MKQTPLTQVPMERPVRLEIHVLAYLGDFMNVFEESIRRKALSNLNTSVPSPAFPRCTASVRNPS